MTITELRAQIGQAMGFGHWWAPFDGSVAAYADLEAADQVALTQKFLDYIKAHPDQFDYATAQAASQMNVQQIDTSSDALGVFVDAVADQAEDLNPFSERNRTKTAAVLIIIASIGALAYMYAKGGGSVVINKGGS